ncbi:uncharacterized protein BCR38DRAFT_485506 [Pseudomassariella vexata]|uniref:Uncharacterized protein n=1 Tax=Pseudomassariella vexata TaxID=1141098 RepID=A0A1Y2DYN2_9PEZI|nr:uncharacterized protein BCR38DRAFT_485506 [Pseudomassariella vexata]ORY64347.1 hypothetical protein BCR38DRAFT_485506 [Pseudomassariella vexata]
MASHSGMSDEELNRDWKPSGRRPQSTIARSFSQELMDIFRIENSVADLDKEVHKKKEQVTTQTSELEALEQRIREMEERLKMQNGATLPAPSTSPRAGPQPLGNAFGGPAVDKVDAQQQQRPTGASRPGTAKQTQQAPAHGGAMPPTPTASEGEYEFVDPSTPCVYDLGGLESRSFTDLVVISKDGDRDS